MSPRGTDGTGRCRALGVHFLGNASSLGPKSTGVQMEPNQNQDGTGTPLSSSTGSFYPNDRSLDGFTFPKVPPPKADRRLKAHIPTGRMTEGPPAAPPRPICTRSWRMWAARHPDTQDISNRTASSAHPAADKAGKGVLLWSPETPPPGAGCWSRVQVEIAPQNCLLPKKLLFCHWGNPFHSHLSILTFKY